MSRVRARWARWIMDTCTRSYDQTWLNYQHEIALRHSSAKKNQTDGVTSVPLIPLRYVIAVSYPMTATIRPFLASKGHPPERVDEMFQAWSKALTLQVALWARIYASPTDW